MKNIKLISILHLIGEEILLFIRIMELHMIDDQTNNKNLLEHQNDKIHTEDVDNKKGSIMNTENINKEVNNVRTDGIEYRINIIGSDDNIVTFIPLTIKEANIVSYKFLCSDVMRDVDNMPDHLPLMRRTWCGTCAGYKMRTPIESRKDGESVYLVKSFLEDNKIGLPGDAAVLVDIIENGDKYAKVPLIFSFVSVNK